MFLCCSRTHFTVTKEYPWYSEPKDDNWMGQLGNLSRKQVDVIVADVPWSFQINKRFDILTPIYHGRWW